MMSAKVGAWSDTDPQRARANNSVVLKRGEVTAEQFKAMLSEFFPSVTLYDYTLQNEQGDDSRVTPLVAVCTK